MTAIEAVEFMKKGGRVKHVQDPPSKLHHRMYHHEKIIALKECGCSCANEVHRQFTEQMWLNATHGEVGGFIPYEEVTTNNDGVLIGDDSGSR